MADLLARLVPYDAEVLAALAAYHHEQMWPAQPVFAGLLVLLLVHRARRGQAATAMLGATLALAWLWSGIAWEWRVHGMLNWAGPWLGALMAAQALLLLAWGVRGRTCGFAPRGPLRVLLAVTALAAGLCVLALGEAAVGAQLVLPPAPVAVITGGVLLLAGSRVRWWLVLLPLVWSGYALCVAWVLGLGGDVALLALAAAASVAAVARRPRAAGDAVPGEVSGGPR